MSGKRRIFGWGGFSVPVIGGIRVGLRQSGRSARVTLSAPVRRKRKLLAETPGRKLSGRGD